MRLHLYLALKRNLCPNSFVTLEKMHVNARCKCALGNPIRVAIYSLNRASNFDPNPNLEAKIDFLIRPCLMQIVKFSFRTRSKPEEFLFQWHWKHSLLIKEEDVAAKHWFTSSLTCWTNNLCPYWCGVNITLHCLLPLLQVGTRRALSQTCIF